MAASSPSLGAANFASSPGASFHDKLNTIWHERGLQLFMLIVLGHWGEHLVQAYQVYVMHWPRPRAGGILGLWYPWLIQSETLHYGYAIVMLAGIWVFRKGFTGVSLKWWTASLVIQFWHHIEHFLLILQATIQHNFFGSPVPVSMLQLVIPRVELHLFYNAVVFVPMIIGMYYHMFPPANERGKFTCSCSRYAHPAATCSI